ncbi:uncharacterized protein TNCV_4300751 [Trichonephila clavipes]|nr:uncharacterized protein TNCV_4300751 [Trichonephila clavipes]
MVVHGSHKLKRDSSEKTTLCQSACQALCSGAHCRSSRKWFVVRGTLACNSRCSRRRRIEEADISTPVAVDQGVANCLEEAVRLFTSLQSRGRSSRADVTFRRLILNNLNAHFW